MIDKIIKRYKEGKNRQDIKDVEAIKKHPCRYKTIITILPVFTLIMWILVPILFNKEPDIIYIFLLFISMLFASSFSYDLYKKYKKAMHPVKKNNINISLKKTMMITILTLMFMIPYVNNVQADSIIDLGTIQYQDYKQINIPGTTEIQLIFITSIMNESDLTVQNLGFVPSMNYTRYLLTSNTITPTFHMKNTSLSYYYQDMFSLQLYKIDIDYNDLVIPVNPVLVNNTILKTKCLDLMSNISNQTKNIENMTKNYNILNESYNQLYTDYNNTMNMLNNSENERDILINNLLMMTKQRNDNRTKYNETKNSMITQLGNLTNLENFYNKIKYVFLSIGVYIPYDATISDTGIIIEDETFNLNERSDGYYHLSSLFPFGIILAIIITFTITMMITYMKWRANRSLSDMELNHKFGYTPLSKKFDSFFQSLGKIKNKAHNIRSNDKNSIPAKNNNAIILDNKTISSNKLIEKNNDNIIKNQPDEIIDKKIDEIDLHNSIDEKLNRLGYYQ